ncbi:MAG: histidinol-phosphate transaminase [Gammaproteobacteria bacterium]|nr:histidinol-phosphate transaminase [Gammaproteobacteria bacterium]
MTDYWSKLVHNLEPYVPGEQPKINNLIKLNTNENPYGPSPRVLDALKTEATDSLRLYPDPNSDKLRQTIADYYGVKSRQVFVGNGSDEVLAHIFQALLKHDKPILYPGITYSFYPVYCALYEIEFETIALDDSFSVNVDDYKKPNGGIIFPNPNAPTGVGLGLEAIKQLLDNNTDSVVVVDEAYIDFGGNTAIALIDQYPNLLVVQTLSKSRSLAGLRLGFAIGNEKLIEALERIKNSFNSYPIDRFASAGAIAAFEDEDHFQQTKKKIITTREKLVADLADLGFKVLPSQANFVFIRHPDNDAAALSQRLREKNIIVRHFAKPRIDQFLRITVGTDAECAALINCLKSLLS